MGCNSGRITMEFEVGRKKMMEPGYGEVQWRLPINEYIDEYPKLHYLSR